MTTNLITDYCILNEDSAEGLQERVLEKMEKGWQPWGSPVLSYAWDKPHSEANYSQISNAICQQAMVRYVNS